MGPRGVGMPEVRRKPVAVVSGVKRDLSGCSRVTVEEAIQPEQWRVGRHRSKPALFRISLLPAKAMGGPEGSAARQRHTQAMRCFVNSSGQGQGVQSDGGFLWCSYVLQR